MKNTILVSLFTVAVSTSSLFAQKGTEMINPSTISSQDPICFKGNDGWISLNLNPSGAPYQILWSNGETASTINNLLAGTYSLMLTNNLGETAYDTITLQEPPATIITGSVINATGTNANDGSIEITTYGQSPTVSFVWTTTNGSGLNQSTINQGSLSPGNYQIAVQNSIGCLSEKTFTITTELFGLNDPIVGFQTDSNFTSTAPNSKGSFVSGNLGNVKLKSGLNTRAISIINLTGARVNTSTIEMHSIDTQELSLEPGRYIAIFEYTDGHTEKQIFSIH